MRKKTQFVVARANRQYPARLPFRPHTLNSSFSVVVVCVPLITVSSPKAPDNSCCCCCAYSSWAPVGGVIWLKSDISRGCHLVALSAVQAKCYLLASLLTSEHPNRGRVSRANKTRARAPDPKITTLNVKRNASHSIPRLFGLLRCRHRQFSD